MQKQNGNLEFTFYLYPITSCHLQIYYFPRRIIEPSIDSRTHIRPAFFEFLEAFFLFSSYNKTIIVALLVHFKIFKHIKCILLFIPFFFSFFFSIFVNSFYVLVVILICLNLQCVMVLWWEKKSSRVSVERRILEVILSSFLVFSSSIVIVPTRRVMKI